MAPVIERKTEIQAVRTALRRSRVVGILGPRQCGKTTLAREFVRPDSLNYFDLESPASLARLSEPETALRPLKGLVVIDEIQRRPELFPLLRVLADRQPLPARFLILGSASPALLRQLSETLAGRLETVPLEGFRLGDLGDVLTLENERPYLFDVSFTCGVTKTLCQYAFRFRVRAVWRGSRPTALLIGRRSALIGRQSLLG
jgi:hypothetical protein